MPKSLFIGLIAALLLVVFAVQNAGEVVIKFFAMEFHSSLSLLIIICIFLGVIVGSSFTYYSISQKNKKKTIKEKGEKSKNSGDKPL